MVLLFAPGYVNSLFFAEDANSTKFFIRILGSTLLGYALINGLIAYKDKKDIYMVVAIGNLLTLSVASLITVAGMSIYSSNALLLPVQHVIFSAGFIVCIKLLRKFN